MRSPGLLAVTLLAGCAAYRPHHDPAAAPATVHHAVSRVPRSVIRISARGVRYEGTLRAYTADSIRLRLWNTGADQVLATSSIDSLWVRHGGGGKGAGRGALMVAVPAVALALVAVIRGQAIDQFSAATGLLAILTGAIIGGFAGAAADSWWQEWPPR